jgi:predicted RNase H-like nuclease (RuvC/YqgF family)
LLKTEAAAKSASEAELVAAIEQVKAHYDSEINKRCAQFEAHINKFAKMVGAREEQIKILQDENTKLTTRCQALAADVQALNSERWNAQEKIESEIAIIKLLNATLYAEREAAGQKIAALVGALEREREQHAAEARKSASVRKEIAMLLPKLMQQSNRLAK